MSEELLEALRDVAEGIHRLSDIIERIYEQVEEDQDDEEIPDFVEPPPVDAPSVKSSSVTCKAAPRTSVGGSSAYRRRTRVPGTGVPARHASVPRTSAVLSALTGGAPSRSSVFSKVAAPTASSSFWP